MENLEKNYQEINIVLNFFKNNKDRSSTLKKIFEIWKNDELIKFLETCPWFKELKPKDKQLFLVAIGERADLLGTRTKCKNHLKNGYILSEKMIEFNDKIEEKVKDKSGEGIIKRGVSFSSFETLFKEIKNLKMYDKDINIYKLFLKYKEILTPQLNNHFLESNNVIIDSQENISKI